MTVTVHEDSDNHDDSEDQDDSEDRDESGGTWWFWYSADSDDGRGATERIARLENDVRDATRR